MLTLSVRQPWAWLILRGGKSIENRRWSTSVRGRILLHASKGMTRGEYDDVALFLRRSTSDELRRIELPARDSLERGGIVGSVEIVDCVSGMDSPWFFGPFGFVLRDPRLLPFRPWRGSLGFFQGP